ncbi:MULTISPECIES: hypothetical protein [Aquimarina]|uniref:AP complex mu/sigma subunit domain-containing protein n=1 Tax=Aquimarina algiphila TaxID=2047982 RepID=A0A554VCK1_9FLAO|nr:MULTISPECIES: hypothetical protein [Aquimarina]TSE04427.1 hypothetical protein FOF46_26235 [Aquimarina algiphila]
MKLKISEQFAKDFKLVKDVSLQEKVKNVLEMLKSAKNKDHVSQLRKIHGNDNAYKMGIGFYFLIAIMSSEQEIILMRLLHKDVLTQVLDR